MIDISLTKEDREFLEQFVKKGTKKARAIARAKVLLFADEGYRHDEISKMTNIHRQSIWRIKKRYVEEGLDSAINEKPRSGQPKKYTEKEEAEIIAMTCTTPPKGRKRWSVRLLTAKMKRRKGFETVNRETVRLILKKQSKTLVEKKVVYSRDHS
jgi:putative transposase